MPQWQATSTKECTSAKECTTNWGHSMGSPDAHLGASATTLAGVVKLMPTDVGEDHSPQDEIVLYGFQANVTTVATTHFKVNTEEAPTYDALFVYVVNCGTAGDTCPEEIVVDNMHASWCNEAYTMVQLPASASSKGTASLHVKVDTGPGGNVLPLHAFKCLYPSWISPAQLGLAHVSTRLTAYNRSHIPLYGALHGPII